MIGARFYLTTLVVALLTVTFLAGLTVTINAMVTQHTGNRLGWEQHLSLSKGYLMKLARMGSDDQASLARDATRHLVPAVADPWGHSAVTGRRKSVGTFPLDKVEGYAINDRLHCPVNHVPEMFL
ncbi:hypothetical protein RJ55_01572 [Drechmeria coniospora]|nr:hypothetical protein RJ55_01572 [Drechmeria coniospora]